MSGTFYVGSLVSEANPFHAYSNKITKLVKAKEQGGFTLKYCERSIGN